MTRRQKMMTIAVVASLIAALIGGATLTATNIAVGTFLFATAMMVGPFVAVLFFVFAVLLRVRPAVRSLFVLGGLLVMTALYLIVVTPAGHFPHLGPRMYVGGGLVGIVALALVRPGSRLRVRLR